MSRYGRRARRRASGHGPDPARTRRGSSTIATRPRSKRARPVEGSRFAAVLIVPGNVPEYVERTQRSCIRSSGALVCRMCRKHQVSGGRFKKEKRFRDKTRPNALSDQTIQCFNGFDDFNQLPGTRWQYPGPLISNIIIIPLLKLRKSGW